MYVGHRRSSDPKLPWLWGRPVATAPIRLLAWEPPYAVGVALEKEKTKNKNKKRTNPSKKNKAFAMPCFYIKKH